MKKFCIIVSIFFLILSIVFLSLYIDENVKLKKDAEEFESIVDNVVIENIVSTPDESHPTSLPAETTVQSTNKPQSQTSTYIPDKVEYKTPAAIDISALSKINKDASGWICLENSPINYPILYSSGNEYLNKNIYGNYTYSGSIFTYDSQNFNSVKEMDKNIVIYGHNMNNGTMFSYVNTLFLNPEYLKNQKNKFIFIYNAENIYKYQIYSVYKIDKKENFNQVQFKDDTSFITFCKTTQKRSVYNDFEYNFTGNDHIITLSTCPNYNSKNQRVILHAVLIDTTKNIY